MTTQGKLSLKGLSEYLEDLAKAGADVNVAADVALLAGADVIQDGMFKAIAAEGLIDTHNLELHIRVKPYADGNFRAVYVGLISDIAFTDADTARYGNAQEYGYTVHGKSFPARSYIRAGFDDSKRAALNAMKESLKKSGAL